MYSVKLIYKFNLSSNLATEIRDRGGVVEHVCLS